jgi:putative transposase
MPIRLTPLVTNEVYHVFNRSNASIPIFKTLRDYKKIMFTLTYYKNANPPVKLSIFNRQPLVVRQEILKSLNKKSDLIVNMICYCIMPNHFHFVLKQTKKDGIKDLIRLLCNSYSHYFNTKNNRSGSVFGGRFKAVRVENENQLQHLVRYIHLNPLTSYIVRNFDDLQLYKYSSLPEYLNLNKNHFCSKDTILKDFKNINKYKEFLLNHSDYQRSLHIIKHQMLD